MYGKENKKVLGQIFPTRLPQNTVGGDQGKIVE
jgi:hypothetical protein